jgi:hypothetical protein
MRGRARIATRTRRDSIGAAMAVLGAACGGVSGEAPAGSSSAAVLAPKGALLEAAENTDPSEQAAPSASAPRIAASAPVVNIPGGRHDAGSLPGDRGRDPAIEPPLAPVELTAFDIDRLPYPNEPGRPALVGVTRAKAASLCEARGRRLCTELEWERACKGDDGSSWASGSSWSRACEGDPLGCASGFGVLGLGALREWTASDVAAVEGVAAGGAVRGADRSAAALDRRCAHRASVDPKSEPDDVGFRCCGGTPNAAKIEPPPPVTRPFEAAKLSTDELATLLATSAPLRKLGSKIELFDADAAPKAVLERGRAIEARGYELTTTPLVWRPVRGEELVVVAGRAGGDAFIVALYRLPEERYRLASSLVLHGDRGPVVLGYDRSAPRRLAWATCWACPGESGRVALRDDGRVVITQE